MLQPGSHTHRAIAGTPSAMWRREGLVEVEVHHVESHVARASLTEHGVQIGSVVVHQSAAFVHQLCYLGNLLFEESKRVGIGHHHGSHIVAEQRLEVGHIDETLRRALHLHDFKTANSS